MLKNHVSHRITDKFPRIRKYHKIDFSFVGQGLRPLGAKKTG